MAVKFSPVKFSPAKFQVHTKEMQEMQGMAGSLTTKFLSVKNFFLSRIWQNHEYSTLYNNYYTLCCVWGTGREHTVHCVCMYV